MGYGVSDSPRFFAITVCSSVQYELLFLYKPIVYMPELSIRCATNLSSASHTPARPGHRERYLHLPLWVTMYNADARTGLTGAAPHLWQNSLLEPEGHGSSSSSTRQLRLRVVDRQGLSRSPSTRRWRRW